MSDTSLEETTEENAIADWRTRALIIGGVAGLLVGLGAAYVYIREAEENDADPSVSTSDAVKIGVSLVSLISSIGGLGKSSQ